MAIYVKRTDKKKDQGPKASELRAMSVEELRNVLVENRENLMQARFKHATASLENTCELKSLRKRIARISTILTEKAQRV